MTYYFSASKNSFYDGELKSAYDKAKTWPDDAVKVSNSIFQEYIAEAPEGKVRGDDSNYPAWVDLPEPTGEELISNALNQKSILISEASSAIAPLQDAVDLDMATDEEKNKLSSWKKYRVLLNRIDTTQAPNITWPDKPL